MKEFVIKHKIFSILFALFLVFIPAVEVRYLGDNLSFATYPVGSYPIMEKGPPVFDCSFNNVIMNALAAMNNNCEFSKEKLHSVAGAVRIKIFNEYGIVPTFDVFLMAIAELILALVLSLLVGLAIKIVASLKQH